MVTMILAVGFKNNIDLENLLFIPFQFTIQLKMTIT